ncbi:MAG: YceI family protein [Pseudomonadota bacterium]
MKRLVLASALAALAAAAQAAPVTYVIDNSHTYPYFTYNHLGFSNQTHRFTKTTGSIVLDRAAKTGSADVTIDTKSVDTGHAVFNEHIQAADYFDTAKHPAITFKGTQIAFKGDQPASISGDITIKGVTRPITFDIGYFNCGIHLMRRVETCGANAVTKIKRSDFNMGKNAPFVSDDVTLTLAVEAYKPQ